jgi:hypothetical protein
LLILIALYRHDVKIDAGVRLYSVPRIHNIGLPHGLVKEDRMFVSPKLDPGVDQRLYCSRIDIILAQLNVSVKPRFIGYMSDVRYVTSQQDVNARPRFS